MAAGHFLPPGAKGPGAFRRRASPFRYSTVFKLSTMSTFFSL